MAEESFVIGRDAKCDVVLADDSVSRRHAELVRTPRGTYLLKDLGSANGTFLVRNGEAMPFFEGAVQPEQTVRLGDIEITVEMLINALPQRSDTVVRREPPRPEPVRLASEPPPRRPDPPPAPKPKPEPPPPTRKVARPPAASPSPTGKIALGVGAAVLLFACTIPFTPQFQVRWALHRFQSQPSVATAAELQAKFPGSEQAKTADDQLFAGLKDKAQFEAYLAGMKDGAHRVEAQAKVYQMKDAEEKAKTESAEAEEKRRKEEARADEARRQAEGRAAIEREFTTAKTSLQAMKKYLQNPVSARHKEGVRWMLGHLKSSSHPSAAVMRQWIDGLDDREVKLRVGASGPGSIDTSSYSTQADGAVEGRLKVFGYHTKFTDDKPNADVWVTLEVRLNGDRFRVTQKGQAERTASGQTVDATLALVSHGKVLWSDRCSTRTPSEGRRSTPDWDHSDLVTALTAQRFGGEIEKLLVFKFQ